LGLRRRVGVKSDFAGPQSRDFKRWAAGNIWKSEMKNLNLLKIGLIIGIIFGLLDKNKHFDEFVAKHSLFSIVLSFGMGALTTILYLSYQQSINGVKLPSFPEGIIKKWNSPARNLTEVFGKRTRDTIVGQWPIKAIKSESTKAEYQRIWNYHQNNLNKTYDKLAEDLVVSRKTVERALKAGR